MMENKMNILVTSLEELKENEKQNLIQVKEKGKILKKILISELEKNWKFHPNNY